MKFAAFVLGIIISTNAFAYTMHRCETPDQSKVIRVLFDAADNYYVFAHLSLNGGDPILGVKTSADKLRPTAANPNHPLLTVKFGASTWVFAFDGLSAELTTDEVVEKMQCCNDLNDTATCADRPH